MSDDATFRARHVGASEVSALFDASPWLTRFELYHRKRGTIATPEFNALRADGTPEDERVYWGVKLEAAIIAGAIERYGYEDCGQPEPLSNRRGLGGHPDRLVRCPDRGLGVLEVKTADWLVRKGWGDEPPLHYLLQSQAYQGLVGASWGDVLVLVGGNALERHCYEFRPKLFADMERRVADFWQHVHCRCEPKPDFTRDGDAIADLHRADDGGLIDLQANNFAADAAARWLAADAECKASAKSRDAAHAELAHMMGDATEARLPGFIVRAPIVAATPDKVITATQVGETIKGRRAYRRFSIKELA